MPDNNDKLMETSRALCELCEAVRDILRDIPELWGDYQVDGMVPVSLSGDNILALEEALRKAEGRD